jgi:UDP-N-acetylmuramoyl-tripeptide--D-alanyl-D-alanine ligase
MEIADIYQIYQQHPSVQTDTWKLKPGDIYIALKGPNFNGNHFARQALDAGASYVMVDEEPGFNDKRLLKVDDSLFALQQLAKFHRGHFNIPFLAITGSNGKTTTKELIHAVLSSTYRTCTTQGNLNNHIGIPLTILNVKKDAEIAVIEMGANHPGEIEAYCKYTLPTHGIITNVGKAHLEGFGGIEGVRKAKGELFDFLRTHKGTVFVMWDFDYLREMCKGIENVIRYGTGDEPIRGALLASDPFLEMQITGEITIPRIRTQLVGTYNLPNVLAAVAVGHYFKVAPRNIKSALENYAPSNSRSQWIEKNGNKIILDAYNANPSSMRLSIENFSRLEGDKVLLLGGMMELGRESIDEHQELLKLIEKYPWKQVVLVGGDFANLRHSYQFFKNAGEARDWLKANPLTGSTILIKGSRSTQMEILMDAFGK